MLYYMYLTQSSRWTKTSRVDMEIVVGTYEHFILGYRLKTSPNYSLELSFTDNSHTSCVKCLAVSPSGVLASGGSDEIIRLLHLRKRVQIGSLVQHAGVITSVGFVDGHMLSASDDQTIAIWRCKKWDCARVLTKHKGGVTSLSIHPTGKMVLSTGKDEKMITWDLIKGRSAFITNIKAVADFVVWNQQGDRYALIFDNKANIYQITTSKVWRTVEPGFRINALVFTKSGHVIVSGEKGLVLVYNDDVQKVYNFSTETVRVKAMCCCQCVPDGEGLFTASSEGFVQLWRLQLDRGREKAEKITEAKCNFRITCMATSLQLNEVYPPPEEKDVKPVIKVEPEETVKEEMMDDEEDSLEDEEDSLEESFTVEKKPQKSEETVRKKRTKKSRKDDTSGKKNRRKMEVLEKRRKLRKN